MAKKIKKQVYLGTDPNGKMIRKWFYADTKYDLKKQIEDYKLEMRKVAHPSTMTFQKYSERWLEIYKGNRSKQTQDMYKNALAKCEDLNPFPVAKITRSMCQEAVSACWQHPSAAKVLADTLRQIFRSAMADGIIAGNPADGLTLPKRPNKRFHLLTDWELDAVARADLSDQDRLFVTILQVFGLRPGEALALQPTDFDFKRGMLLITKAVELSNDNRSRIKDTKTGVSREIPIPGTLIAPLRAHFRANPGFLLFPKADGSLYTKSAYRRLSDRIHKALNEVVIKDKIEKLKVKTPGKEASIRSVDYFPEFTLYSFRHRRATEIYYLTQSADPAKRISTKKAAALMGHSELVFLATYSHIMESRETADIYSNATLPEAQNL